ncbi:MAG: lytic murein transglycosylase [Gammaproteobacteria bacterium]|nr:lytic murein transglycosylase [Gammaproteobacteria bacterium]
MTGTAAIRRIAALLTLAAAPAAAGAQVDFEQCVAALRATAEERGVTPQTAETVTARVRQLPRVIESDRNQPEFVDTFASYLNRRVTAARVETGRELLRRHRSQLDSIAREFGVAPQYLVAFWGLETSYGRVLGDVPVFDSLATLACDTRRAGYFTTEFVNALHIVDRGVDASSMIGSWAGAMGHTQFMPSVYLEHAVDGDGDGDVDLWSSVEDAFASAASFLRSLGWRPGWRWGREVLLPEDFDYYAAGRDRPRPLEEWRQLGVMTTAGRPIEPADEEAALLLPSGSDGPAFLVYANFHAIMRWNRSEFFALTVGHLADRIAGAGPLHTPPPNAPRLTREHVKALQVKLNELGYDAGEPDGIVGSATRSAVRAWQRSQGLAADGYVDADLLRGMNVLD